MAKLEKIRLDLDFEFAYEVWGIVTSLDDYKLAWMINRFLDFKLARTEDYELENPARGLLMYFNCFHYYDEIELTDIYLIKNKYYSHYLLPELKSFDYIIKIEGNYNSEYSAHLFKLINQLPEVQLLKGYQPEELKSNANIAYL